MSGKYGEHAENEAASCKTVIANKQLMPIKKTAAPMPVGNGGHLSLGRETSTAKLYPNIRPDAIESAARWLSSHRNELIGKAVIPVLKERFGLRNIEAIEATKMAHSIAYGGGHV